MKFRIWLKYLVASVSVLIPSSIAAQEATDLRVGQVIGSEDGQVINGWTQTASSMYIKRSYEKYGISERYECCVVIFKKGSIYLFAATDPIALNQSGSAAAERITVIKKFTIPTDEEEAPDDCKVLGWVNSVKSFSRGLGNPIRSIIFDNLNLEFFEIRWFERTDECQYYQD